MKTSALLSALSIVLFPVFASAESVEEIVNRFEREKVDALTAYLEANPEASDRDTALSVLIDSHGTLGNNDAIVTLLEQRYDTFDKGPGINLGELFNGIVQPLVGAYTESAEKEKALVLIDRVAADTADHPMAPQIGQFLDQLRGSFAKPMPGDTLTIAFKDLDGHEVDLAAMKDKVVLVDFWATWCGPCIEEMPNVIAAYEKFHSSGFEVIGISLDQDKEALKSYLESNSMPWPQYFDGKGWENELAGQYGITGIPATFLIGKDGKVAATDLRGPALEEKIAELLK